ncbi:hypothetical protein IHE44_0006398, partial [Lamprotornis superbus]
MGKGANSYGQLGLGHKEDVLVPQALKDVSCKCRDITSIAGGGGHSAVTTGTGQLFVCGGNKDGQLGLNHTEDVLHFTLCTALSGFCVKQVACGWDFTIILVGSGLVLSCGSNSFGQLGLPQISGPCLIPQKIESLKEKVVNVAAGLRHALAATGLEDVKVKTVAAGSYHSVSLTGSGLFMARNSERICRSLELQQDALLDDWLLLEAVKPFAHGDEGHLYVWGSNKHGQLVSRDIFLAEPKKIDTQCFSHEKIGAVWSGWTHLVAQTDIVTPESRMSEACYLHALESFDKESREAGTVFTWGRGDYGQLGRHVELPVVKVFLQPPLLADVT